MHHSYNLGSQRSMLGCHAWGRREAACPTHREQSAKP